MANSNKPLLLGNWKMNPETLGQAKKLFVTVRNTLRKYKDLEIAVAPPMPYISDLGKLSPSGRIGLMSQDVWYVNKGSETGEVSVPMIKSCGADYVIVGHSERRAQGESCELIAKKLQAVHKGKLIPILCVGETDRDAEGKFYSTIQEQIKTAFADCSQAAVARTVIAYEPVWAIGSGQTPDGYDVQEMRLFIEKTIVEMFSRAIAKKVRIIYGGSVKAKNAADLFTNGYVDGFLVGSASLEAKEFAGIAESLRASK